MHFGGEGMQFGGEGMQFGPQLELTWTQASNFELNTNAHCSLQELQCNTRTYNTIQ